jgi:hypothetical protein
MARLQQLTEEQVQDSFRRAQEIAHQHAAPSAGVEERIDGGTDIESYLAAAEELGIPREAAIQALREKMLLPVEDVKAGDLVFAPSLDGRHYPATVVRPNGASVVVCFVGAGEHTVPAASLHPLSLVPGLAVEYEEKDWGWIAATVKSFDTAKQKVEVGSMWETKKVALGKIRLAVPKKPRTPREMKVRQLVWRVGLITGGAGVTIGWLVGYFLR